MYLDRCQICSRVLEEGSVCPDCLSELKHESYNNFVVRCPECGEILSYEGEPCDFCQDFPGIRLYKINPYSGINRKIIEYLKFSGYTKLAPVMSAVVSDFIGTLGLQGPVAVVPVPASRSGLKKRGFDQMKLVARVCRFPSRDILVRKSEKTQKILSREERLKGLDTMFGLSSGAVRIPEQNLVVIDDICTTGTTLVSAMKTLSETGKNVIGISWTGSPYKGTKKW